MEKKKKSAKKNLGSKLYYLLLVSSNIKKNYVFHVHSSSIVEGEGGVFRVQKGEQEL